MSRFWSSVIQQLSPYVPGEQPKATGSGELIKLNTNENPYPPSPEVVSTIQRTAEQGLQKYPDPNGQVLKETIADYYHLQSDQVFVGNSSDEVLAHTFHAFFTDRVGADDKPLCFPDITYGFYPVYAKLYRTPYKLVPLAADFSFDIEQIPRENRGVIFANPNAPTGLCLGLTKIEQLLQTHADSVVVVDEAYVDFGGESAIALINQYENLLVTQTFSKSRSLAGLRLGYACGNADLIEALERVKNSFNAYPLDHLAIAGGSASFNDESYFQTQRSRVIATRQATMSSLRELGFTVLDSSANFVFAKPPQTIAAKALFQELRQRDIIVRYFDKPRIDEYLRITIGTDAEMQQLIKALGTILA
ncbi:MAG: histidinol-phosphate transaminase [Arenicella sp.]